MKSNFLIPVASFHYQGLCLTIVALHVLTDESVEDDSKLIRNLLKGLLLELFDLGDNLVIGVLPDEFQLRVEAVIELSKNVLS